MNLVTTYAVPAGGNLGAGLIVVNSGGAAVNLDGWGSAVAYG